MTLLAFSAGVVGLAVVAASAPAQTDGVVLQRGIDLMETRGDCAAAISVFKSLTHSADRSVAARALLHWGRCLEPSQREDAIAIFRRVAREYADQHDVRRRAEERLKILAPPIDRAAGLSAVLQGPAAFTVIHQIYTGAEPYDAIRSPDGSRIFVTNLSDPSVAVIDVQTNRVTKKFALDAPPLVAALSWDGASLLLAHLNQVASIDLDSGARRSFTVAAETIHDLTPAPEGGAYLATGRTGLKRLDLATGEVRTVHPDPCPVSLSLLEERLWVNYQCGGPGGRPGHDVIGEFDAASGRLLQTIRGIPNVGGWIESTPDGGLLMASAGDACSHPNYDHVGCKQTGVALVHVFVAETRTLVRSIAFAEETAPHAFRFIPRRRMVAFAVGAILTFMSTRDFAVVTSLPLSSSGRLAFSADGSHAFVPLPSEDAVAVVWLGSAGGE